MSRSRVLSDSQWEKIASLMPVASVKGGRPFGDHRLVVEAIIWRYRTGVPWRDLPAEFGPWQTVWKRHNRFSRDGTWDRVHAVLLTRADAAGAVDWAISVDSTINRAHQHATTLHRVEEPAGRRRAGDTGGTIELQESAPGTS